MLGLAKAQYGLGQAAQARQTLDALIAANPSFRSQEGHLLYARAVEDSGDVDAVTPATAPTAALLEKYSWDKSAERLLQILNK